MKARFGPAGNSKSFAKLGYKHSLQVPEYVSRMGLDHYEYQCGRGIHVSQETAQMFAGAARKHGISVSLHSPYYISLSSAEEEKRDRSVEYILQSARTVLALGGSRIVVHSGSCATMSRPQALELAAGTIRQAISALKENGLYDMVHICPETMGKINQLGDLEEVISLCEIDEMLIPCIDFGHLNARTLGMLKNPEEYKKILDSLENRLGRDRASQFHAHFSKIAYTSGGEKKHLTFEDTDFGPDFEPLLDLIVQRNFSPIIVCESAGTQAEDAKMMKDYYESLAAGREE